MGLFDKLTPRQLEVYTFIREKIRGRGYGPTVREIADEFKIDRHVKKRLATANALVRADSAIVRHANAAIADGARVLAPEAPAPSR